MQRMMDAVITALNAADVPAVQAMPPALLAPLSAPVTAVGLKSAKAEQEALFSYLGLTERNGSQVPLYGKKLKQVIFLQVVCPRGLGADRCLEEAETVVETILDGVDGVQIGEVNVGGCEYDQTADLLTCTITAACEGFLYAVADGDETEFTDFILKGEAT